MQMLAMTTFDLGEHDKALELAREAHQLAAAVTSPTHPDTLEAQIVVLDQELELGLTEAAQRDYMALARAFRERPDAFKQRLAMLEGGAGASLELHKRNAKQAEQMARTALATLRELKAQPYEQRVVTVMLGESLLAQHRNEEALAAFSQALELARQANERADYIAAAEIGIARAEAAAGRRREALERARAARKVLEGFPGQIIARRDADRLLAGR